MKIFKERFNEVLKYTDKTQVQIAYECGISKQSMTAYKAGAMPSVEVLKKLCIALDVSADYLLGLSNFF